MTRLFIVFLSAIVFYSCQSITGSGNIISQTREMSQFKGIKNAGSIDVVVTNNENQLVKVEADDNILPYIITEVKDGLLNVHLKSHISLQNFTAIIYVSAPLLNTFMVAGSGSIISKDTLKDMEQIKLKVSGSGDINAFVDAPQITAGISGSGTITLHGKTKNFNCSISGSGDIKCNNLLSENTTVIVSGSGTAHVFASVNLAAKVSGSGNIYYSGNPSSPEIKKSGSGSVQAEK